MKIKQMIIVPICIGLFLTIIAAPVAAKYFLETEIFSGKVTSLKDNVIEINGKTQFLPAPSITKSGVRVGSTVTIRYYINRTDDNVYVEVKKGKNSIKKSYPPRPKKETPL